MLADEPGLGKTLTVLSLVIASAARAAAAAPPPPPPPPPPPAAAAAGGGGGKRRRKSGAAAAPTIDQVDEDADGESNATLIVAPNDVMRRQWAAEIARFARSADAVRVVCYDGLPGRGDAVSFAADGAATAAAARLRDAAIVLCDLEVKAPRPAARVCPAGVE